ncbi:MAG TPA: S53 family peptidase [Terriglobia bacterium]|nr:S53 family peptidase [Terriglobia bacterium]
MRKPLSKALSIVWTVMTSSAIAAHELPKQPMLRRGDVLIPASSLERAEDVGRGLRAHTNHMILVTPEMDAAARDTFVGTKPYGETPATIRSAYKMPSSGGAGAIAIVDAYDDPTAESDLDTFSATFGLPACTTANGCFHKMYASGKRPAVDCGWAQEISLDIEWAHALAPEAKIVLVEAASNSSTDLFRAVDLASTTVNTRSIGFGEVSMSWGFSEFAGEQTFDTHFHQADVVYFASSGDVGGQRIYPGVSPDVVSVGGTTIHRDAAGHFLSETAWSDSGGGPSAYESRPAFQDVIVTIVGSHRGAPDAAFDADPHSGVAIYDSTACQGVSGWLTFGGTSLSAPATAGVVNLAGHFYHSSEIELSTMYSNRGTANFRDILTGTAGSFTARKGWDFVTGIGTSLGVAGK